MRITFLPVSLMALHLPVKAASVAVVLEDNVLTTPNTSVEDREFVSKTGCTKQLLDDSRRSLRVVARDPDVERHLSDESIQQEWLEISANNTRRVFNFGIGSLTSWAGRQYTSDQSQPLRPELVDPAYPGYALSIRREFTYCWRYVALNIRKCNQEELDNEVDSSNATSDTPICPPLLGVFFEVTKDEYPSLRERESSYDLVQVEPVQPLPAQLPADAFYFAWGSNGDDGTDETDDVCSGMGFPPVLSQAYWDFIIGGLLSWDGMFLDTNRYTWDLEMELNLTATDVDKISIANLEHKAPSYDLEERRKVAVDFVKSTEASKLEWADDRRCPLTGNAVVAPSPDGLAEFIAQQVTGPAIGTAGPMADLNNIFFRYVDQILIDGGWGFKGAANSIYNRVDICSKSQRDRGFQYTDHSEFKVNRYYEDIMDWRNATVGAVKNRGATSGGTAQKPTSKNPIIN